MLPDLLGLLVFVVGPILYALFLSFHEWNAFSSPAFVGFDNYQRLWGDPQFWSSLRVTALYTFSYVPIVFAVSLGLAVLVSQRLPFIGMFRTLFFVPVVLSLVVSALMWKFIFDERVGFLNYLLNLVGLPSQPWLGSVELALPAIVMVSVWIHMGYYMVIFLAGIQDIPKLYYDAAKIDGANALQAFLARHPAAAQADQPLRHRHLTHQFVSGVRPDLGDDQRRSRLRHRSDRHLHLPAGL